MNTNPKCTGYEPTLGLNRRSFLQRFGGGLGGGPRQPSRRSGKGLHHEAKAKRVIYLFSLVLPPSSTCSILSPGLLKKPERSCLTRFVGGSDLWACQVIRPAYHLSVHLSSLSKKDKVDSG